MSRPWFYKEVKGIKGMLDGMETIIDKLISKQEEKLDNYLVSFEGSPNYLISEERLETLSDLKDLFEEISDKLSDL
jgi:hypothetical protein